MNKNEKFHGADFEVNAPAISDDELDAVSGGYGVTTVCPKCGATVYGNPTPLNLEDAKKQPSRMCIQCDYVEW